MKNVYNRPRMMPKSMSMSLRPDERAYYGVIVTLREQTTRELLTIVSNGKPMPALRDACSRIDAMTGNWLISTISTPSSIFRDLQGDHDPHAASNEVSMLARVRRRDLLEPKRKIYIGER